MKYDYVIYHRGCLDGYTSFVILSTTKTISPDAIIYTDDPYASNIPPNIDGKNVIIMDVAYKKEVLQKIVEIAKHVTFIDHHVTIKNEIKQSNNLEIVYDVDESGASLVWKYFYKSKKAPKLVQYIKENDTASFPSRDTLFFILALNMNYSIHRTPENLIKWKKLLLSNITVHNLVKEGKIYQPYKEYIVSENSKKYSFEQFPSAQIYKKFKTYFTNPGQYKVVLYNGHGCPDTRSLSARFLEKTNCDFVMLWVLNMEQKKYVIQLRSIDVDVGSISKLFGGGGHRLASAFSLTLGEYSIQDLFFPTSLLRAPN